MKLHWSPRSPFVRKVMIAAHERGLVDRIVCVRTIAAMTKPHAELMADNPLSKIPTLVLDDGLVLYDSPVICEYLDGIGGAPKLFPAEPAARFEALRRQALGDGFFLFDGGVDAIGLNTITINGIVLDPFLDLATINKFRNLVIIVI